jgi:hypothetical protein
LNFSKNDSQNCSFLYPVLLGNEWFFGDKAGSENRSLECPVSLLNRDKITQLLEIQWPVFLIANWRRTILLENERFLNIRMVLGTGHSIEQFRMN